MTLEDFAHRCLMIKAGNATLDIPCCANCKYYKSLTFSDGDTIYECHHPSMDDCESVDESGILYMAPEDFCSRWESRNEEKEVKEKNKKARKRT